MSKSGGSGRLYRPDIDGIRAVAILSVVFYHYGVPWFVGGFTGVDVFFVISGYLIGGHIYSEVRTGGFSFLRFYQRRAKRILPAYYAMMVFVLLASLFLLSPFEIVKVAESGIAATFSASNIAFWISSDYFNPASELHPLLMTWSLGVEEQFYIITPLLMVLLARIRRNWIPRAVWTVCIFSFLLACCELGSYPKNVFYLLPERAWELGIGVGLAVTELTGKRIELSATLTRMAGLGGMGLMLAPIFLLSSKMPFPGAMALPSVLGTALVIAVPSSWINRKLLSFSPLVFVGRISYSLYLWHWPLLTFLRITAGGMPPRTATYLSMGAAFAAATLSYYFIERPFRRSLRAPVPLLIRYGIVSALFILVCAVAWLSKGIPLRFPQLDGMERTTAYRLKADPCLSGSDALPVSPVCYDRSDPRPSVAIWGDSHAAALAQGMRAVADSQGYGLVEIGRTSCVALAGAANYRPSIPLDARQCIQFNHSVLNLLEADPRVKIVVLTGVWANSFQQIATDRWLINDVAHERETLPPEIVNEVFRHSLTATILGLEKSGKQVIVMEDVPSFALDPVLRIRTAQIPARHTLALWMGVKTASDPGYDTPRDPASVAIADAQLRIVVKGLNGVPLIDLKTELCRNDNECAYRIGERVFYSDGGHLDADGARYVLRDFSFPALVAPGS
ncbi:MAG: acyltransferase family protein [Terracidiphilus sp.]